MLGAPVRRPANPVLANQDRRSDRVRLQPWMFPVKHRQAIPVLKGGQVGDRAWASLCRSLARSDNSGDGIHDPLADFAHHGASETRGGQRIAVALELFMG